MRIICRALKFGVFQRVRFLVEWGLGHVPQKTFEPWTSEITGNAHQKGSFQRLNSETVELPTRKKPIHEKCSCWCESVRLQYCTSKCVRLALNMCDLRALYLQITTTNL